MFKILVVEDDKELNKTVCSFLNHSGYEAVGCLDANEAYDALYENIFDAIISDITIVIDIIIIVIKKFSPMIEYMGKNMIKKIGTDSRAPMKFDKHILL